MSIDMSKLASGVAYGASAGTVANGLRSGTQVRAFTNLPVRYLSRSNNSPLQD